MIKKLTILFIMFSIATFTACGIDLSGELNKILPIIEGTAKWDQAKWDQNKWSD